MITDDEFEALFHEAGGDFAVPGPGPRRDPRRRGAAGTRRKRRARPVPSTPARSRRHDVAAVVALHHRAAHLLGRVASPARGVGSPPRDREHEFGFDVGDELFRGNTPEARASRRSGGIPSGERQGARHHRDRHAEARTVAGATARRCRPPRGARRLVRRLRVGRRHRRDRIPARWNDRREGAGRFVLLVHHQSREDRQGPESHDLGHRRDRRGRRSRRPAHGARRRAQPARGAARPCRKDLGAALGRERDRERAEPDPADPGRAAHDRRPRSTTRRSPSTSSSPRRRTCRAHRTASATPCTRRSPAS